MGKQKSWSVSAFELGVTIGQALSDARRQAAEARQQLAALREKFDKAEAECNQAWEQLRQSRQELQRVIEQKPDLETADYDYDERE